MRTKLCTCMCGHCGGVVPMRVPPFGMEFGTGGRVAGTIIDMSKEKC